jgi:hypothetical protein
MDLPLTEQPACYPKVAQLLFFGHFFETIEITGTMLFGFQNQGGKHSDRT